MQRSAFTQVVSGAFLDNQPQICFEMDNRDQNVPIKYCLQCTDKIFYDSFYVYLNRVTAGILMNRRLLPIILLLFLLVPLFAESGTSGGESLSEALFSHIQDSNVLELFPFLPEIHLPAFLTVHRLMLFMSGLLVFAVFALVFRKPGLKPGVAAVGLEMVVLFIRDDIVYPVMGEERGERWLPFFTTMFLFILVINLIGLIPAFKTATGNINVTSAMAVMVFVLMVLVGFSRIGVVHFFKNFIPEDTALPIAIFVALLELLGFFIKIMVLSLRIFANMFAGHLAILSFIALIFVLSPIMAAISIPFALFTYTLEVLVALIQALVFTLLSCIFITQASSAHG